MRTSFRERTTARTRQVITVLIACLWSSSVAAQPTLQKIVDSADPVPGAPAASWESFRPFFDVVIDGDDLAFIGLSDEPAGLRDGVYLYRGGSLEVVADTETLRPGTAFPFASFWRVAMGDGVLAFTNEDRLSMRAGAYRYDAKGLRVVADHTTVIPGSEPSRFVSFGDIAVHQGTVLFGAGAHQYFAVWHQDGLYLSADSVLARVVDSSTPIPEGGGNFELLGNVGLDAAGFAFSMPRHDTTAEDGIYRNLGAGIEVVADLSTVAPHTGSLFESFSAFSYDEGAVAFNAMAGGEGAVYLHDGALRIIASRQTPYPGAGRNFAGFFNRIATSGGRVAFMGFWNPPGQFSRVGLFVADGSELTKITEIGTQLDGRVVTDIDLSPAGLDWPHLAFTVGFEDGGSALYRLTLGEEAEPPPPPGPWLTTPALAGFRVQVRITAGGSVISGQTVTPCVGETLCVSGALPDRAELFVRVIGPRPNGKLWPTLVKFSTSRIEVWIEQTSRGVVRYYDLPPVTPGQQMLVLDGLADKLGFDP